MANVAALYQAVVLAFGGDTFNGTPPPDQDQSAVAALAALAIGAVGLMISIKLVIAQKLPIKRRLAALLAVLPLTVAAIGGAFVFLGRAPVDASPIVPDAAQVKACDKMLAGLREGQVRWLPSAWSAEISADCGADELVDAANAPRSAFQGTL